MSVNPQGSTEPRPDQPFAIDALHIFVLFAFAVAQPIFNVLGRGSEFFVAHEAGPADILLLVAAVCLGPPAVVASLAWLAGFGGRSAQRVVVTLFVGILFAAILLQASKWLFELPSAAALPLALVLGAAAALAHSRSAAVRTFVTVLSPGLVIFPGLFIFGSPVSGLVFPARGGTAAHSIGGDVPIVFVVFDQLAQGALLDARHEIDADFYPNFAALADEAIWFRNASSVANNTSVALPAILTGNYPAQNDALPTVADHPDNLFTFVGGNYRLEVFEPITGMCPATLCPPTPMPWRYRLSAELSDLVVVYGHLLLPVDLAERLPSITQSWSGFGGSTDRADQYRASQEEQEAARWQNRWIRNRDGDRRLIIEEFLQAIDATDEQPSLYFLHALLPHEPYLYLPSGQQYTRTEAMPGLQPSGRWERNAEAIAEARQRYLWQVRYVDSVVGRLVDRLRSVGLYDRSLLIIASDHGASFLAGDIFKHPSTRNYSDIMNVPLLIKLPGQVVGRTSDRNVETIDILPTLADALGAELPWEIDGISALDEEADERDGKVMYDRRGRVSRRAGANLLDRTHFLLGQRIAALGAGDDPSSQFRFGPYPELVGMPLDSLPVGASTDAELTLDLEEELADVHPASDFVPALLTGQLRAHVDEMEVVPLAVAINGVIRATATSFDFQFGGRGEVWTALVDPSSLIVGFNRIDLFALSGAVGEAVLNHVYRLYDDGETDNLVLPAAQFSATVRQDGWGETVWFDGEPLRWTGHDATLFVPVDTDAPPTVLELAIARRAAGARTLRVTAGKCVLFEGEVTEIPWRREFELDDCGFGDVAAIELRTSSAGATGGFGVAGVFLRSAGAGS